MIENEVNREIGEINKHLNKQDSIDLLYEPFNENIGFENLFQFYLFYFVNILYILKLDNMNINLIELNKNKISFIIKSKSNNINTNDLINNKEYFHIFLLLILFKFGNNNLLMVNIDEIRKDEMKIFELIERYIFFLLSKKLANKKHIKFFLRLIDHKPEKRPNFDEIYKSLNNMIDNKESIRETIYAFPHEEKKIIELKKKDLLYKNKINRNNSLKFRFKKKVNY